jgi:hypothetical protein
VSGGSSSSFGPCPCLQVCRVLQGTNVRRAAVPEAKAGRTLAACYASQRTGTLTQLRGLGAGRRHAGILHAVQLERRALPARRQRVVGKPFIPHSPAIDLSYTFPFALSRCYQQHCSSHPVFLGYLGLDVDATFLNTHRRIIG